MSAVQKLLESMGLHPKDSPLYGGEILEALELNGMITVAVEPPEGSLDSAPLAAASDLEVFRSCENEGQLVNAVAPLLQRTRDFDAASPFKLVLVNSEAVQWLDTLHEAQPFSLLKKPDLFTTWEPFWSGHFAALSNVPVGKLSGRVLQLDGCACEFYEAKLGDKHLTNEDFGQLADYHSRTRGEVRGMLFNAREFWLYASFRNKPLHLTKCLWGARGSRSVFTAFFNRVVTVPPLVRLLRFVMRELGVGPHRIKVATDAGAVETIGTFPAERSFLGAGLTARVFAVRRASDGAFFALKVSTQLSHSALSYEFEVMRGAATSGAPVAAVVDGSLTLYFDEIGKPSGGGFLLRDIGKRVDLSTMTRGAAAFKALHALHAAGFIHGDARTPNILEVSGRYVWIDMREATENSLDAARRADVATLAASILSLRRRPISAAVDAAIEAIPGGGDAYSAVAAAVWEA